MPVKNQKWIYNSTFSGAPKPSDFKFVEDQLPEVGENEVHFKAVAISVDPYMRVLGSVIPPGGVMFGAQVAKVVKSRNPKWKVGDAAVGYFGWQTNWVGVPEDIQSPFGGIEEPYEVPQVVSNVTHALGAAGLTGNSAYFGMMELCCPKPGETVVVSGAAGAVGSLAGQIAKIQGARVIGFAGSDAKVDWLVSECGFDKAFNYKKISVVEALKTAAPKGVDCYFDNVGGQMTADVISCMNSYGRVAVCGSIANYNADRSKPVLVPDYHLNVIIKQIKMEGFLAQRWLGPKWIQGIHQLAEWINQGKIVPRETVTNGFLNIPSAFIAMLKGDNIGKAVVTV
uniref:15-oxoprostaglandin 13-reductase n=2 Tax=Lygus hesperus TaxID=30085 RepID=A0A0A9X296_LYGHE